MDRDERFTDRTRPDSASSAVRNLNDFEIMNRKLRVDFSNDGTEDDNVRLLSDNCILLP
jgi:hypothetical protein